ncbi:MAG TPA: hypothetical protein VGB19_12170 [Actinomycetota bacterium]
MGGYEDALRQAQEMAQRMGVNTGQAGAATPMGMDETAAIRDLAMKLNQSGVEIPATITSVQPTGRTDFGGGQEVAFGVQVEPPGGQPYAASFNQFMVASLMGGVVPGARIKVRVDPDNPSAMMFWGFAG